MSRASLLAVLLSAGAGPALVVAACATNPEPILVAPQPLPVASASTSAPAAVTDALGPRPSPPEPAPYLPPSPEVFDGPAGSKIWLLERHTLPLVAVAAVVPVGAAAEPAGLGGLAMITADMMDEGAGARDALAFSSALDALGAQLTSSADRDRSTVMLEVVSSKLPEALSLLGDAVVRPRHDAKDFRRVSSLWKNALKARGDDPNGVARLVSSAAFFGLDNPYGRPVDGTLQSAQKLRREDVLRWHKAIWRPDMTTFVVVGDTTRSAIRAELDRVFGGYAAPKDPKPQAPEPSPPAPTKGPRTVLVDRPDAPQIVVSVLRPGVAAGSPDLPRLALLNVALGGSFTSRLNQNLREDHGWTYGASSRFAAQRWGGMFLARAAIRTDAVTDALREMLREVSLIGREGLREDEVSKVRALVRADAIESYGSVRAVAASLAANAALGLPPDEDARELGSQITATRGALSDLAGRYLGGDGVTIVLVGPRKAIEQALSANGLPAPEVRDVQGRPAAPPGAKAPR